MTSIRILIVQLIVLLVTAVSVFAQSQTEVAQANKLFVTAVKLYKSSGDLPPAKQEKSHALVRALFEEIEQKYPETRPAKIVSGGAIPGIDLNELPAASPKGWNSAKRSIVAQLLRDYNGERKRIRQVAKAYDYALISLAVYGDEEALNELGERGWKRLESFTEPSVNDPTFGDAHADLFSAPNGRHVLGFRGTVTAGDWKTNLYSMSCNPDNAGQIEAARRIAGRVVGRVGYVEFTGHSLGGRMAMAARRIHGTGAVIFNSAPPTCSDWNRAQTPNIPLAPLVAFRSPLDPLTGVFSRSDVEISNIPDAQIDGFLEKVLTGDFTHAMSSIVKAISDTATAEEEGWTDAFELQNSIQIIGAEQTQIQPSKLLRELRSQIDVEVAKLTENSRPLELLQTAVKITEYWLAYSEVSNALPLVMQTMDLPKWQTVLSPKTVDGIKKSATNAELNASASVVSIVGPIFIKAILEAYVDDWIREKSSNGIEEYLVSLLHETVDGAFAAAPIVVAGGASTAGGLMYPIAKVIEVLIELDRLKTVNAKLVDDALIYAKAQISAVENIPSFDVTVVQNYISAQTDIAQGLMSGNGLNVNSGRRLDLINMVLDLRFRQLVGKDFKGTIDQLNAKVAFYDQNPGNWWNKWAKFTNFGRDGLQNFSGFAAAVADTLGVERVSAPDTPTQSLAACTDYFELRPGEVRCGFAISKGSRISHNSGFVSEPVNVTIGSTQQNKVIGSLRISPSPDIGVFFIQVCEPKQSGATNPQCWSEWILDLNDNKISRLDISKHGSESQAFWSRDGTLFAVFTSTEDYQVLNVVEASTGGFLSLPTNDGDPTTQVPFTHYDRKYLRWNSDDQLQVRAGRCTDSQGLDCVDSSQTPNLVLTQINIREKWLEHVLPSAKTGATEEAPTPAANRVTKVQGSIYKSVDIFNIFSRLLFTQNCAQGCTYEGVEGNFTLRSAKEVPVHLVGCEMVYQQAIPRCFPDQQASKNLLDGHSIFEATRTGCEQDACGTALFAINQSAQRDAMVETAYSGSGGFVFDASQSGPAVNLNDLLREGLFGVAEQTGVRPYSIRVKESSDGRVAVEYPELNCGGSWTPRGQTSKRITFTERITFGRQKCTATGTTVLELRDDGTVDYKYFRNDGTQSTTAMLRATSPQKTVATKDGAPLISIAGNQCAASRKPISAGQLRSSWVGKQMNGVTAKGANWSLVLDSPAENGLGKAVFSNSKGERSTGLWRYGNGGLCQSYNGGSAWVCYSVSQCEGTSSFALKNSEGDFTSLVSAGMRPGSGGSKPESQLAPSKIPGTEICKNVGRQLTSLELSEMFSIQRKLSGRTLYNGSKSMFRMITQAHSGADAWTPTTSTSNGKSFQQHYKIDGEEFCFRGNQGTENCNQLAICEDPNVLIVAGKANEVGVWTVETLQPEFKLQNLSDPSSNSVSENDQDVSSTAVTNQKPNFTFTIDKCRKLDVWPNAITVNVMTKEDFHQPWVEQKYSQLSWDLLNQHCDVKGDSWGMIKFNGETQIEFSQPRFQPFGEHGWYNKRNHAWTRHEGEMRRQAQQKKDALRRAQQAARRKAEQEAAARKAAELQSLKARIDANWKQHMDQQFSGRVVVANIVDMLNYNRPKAIQHLSKGVELSLSTNNLQFQNSKVILSQKFYPTDIYKQLKQAQLQGMGGLQAFETRRQQVSQELSVKTLLVVCNLDVSALDKLDGVRSTVVRAKLSNLSQRSAVFDCKIR